MATILNAQFALGARLHVITNGYDPEELVTVRPQEFPEFAIVYAGTFYPPKGIIDPVFEALAPLKGDRDKQRCQWRFHYYGDQAGIVQTVARRWGITDRVTLHGRCSRAECLSAWSGAAVGVVITTVQQTNDLADLGIVTGKVFECVSLAKSTLIVAPNGSDVALMFKNESNVEVLPGSSIEQITRFFRGRFAVSASSSGSSAKFAWPALARQFDAVLRSALNI
jgi:glycosyltransferase involved in cell wall biosynthesis